MSKRMRQKWLAGTIAIGLILAAPATVWSQVAGRVQSNSGAALSGAIVEVWDNYPSGSILGTGTTNGQGEFSIAAVAGSEVDLRVRRPDGGFKATHYPTVVRNLPQPTSNTSVRLVPVPSVTTSPSLCDFYNNVPVTFLGASVQAGDVIEVIAQSGDQCGVAAAASPGNYLAHAYGDDLATEEVDGPLSGEVMGFRVNAVGSTVNNAPVTFFPFGNKAANLSGTASVQGITLVGPTDATGSAGHSAFILFVITNSGMLAGNFTVEVELDQPWQVIIQSVAGLGLNLNPGASADVLAEIKIPQGTLDQTVEFRARVSSDTYGQANSGAWTALEVSTTSDVGDGGNGLVPNSFSLLQNYPNPFNAGTNISFTLENGGPVSLTVCNLLGQTMRTLMSEYREPGIYTESWDGRDDRGEIVPSGIYFSRLLQNDQSQVRKMVLLK